MKKKTAAGDFNVGDIFIESTTINPTEMWFWKIVKILPKKDKEMWLVVESRDKGITWSSYPHRNFNKTWDLSGLTLLPEFEINHQFDNDLKELLK